ncbi:hypothetical protein [Pirellulimonas nuda]|nr:hypothetical protein [Pirellulimonas nuda]
MSTRLLALAALALLIPTPSAARCNWLDRVRDDWQSVQGTPLENRSNRLGHFYGNNVRRVQQRKVMVNAGVESDPLRTYFYAN